MKVAMEKYLLKTSSTKNAMVKKDHEAAMEVCNSLSRT